MSTSDTSPRVRLRLEFEGTNFAGWQLQDEGPAYTGKPSIQGCVEQALATYFRQPQTRMPVQGCGRTDAGVHAEEFFCHFDLPEQVRGVPQDLERLRHSVNCLLPEGIVATRCDSVPTNFHALKDARGKTYEYRVLLRRAKPTWQSRFSWWVPIDAQDDAAFDRVALAAALARLEGTHDFVAFAAADFSAKTSVRTLYSCGFTEQNVAEDVASGVLLRMSFEGSGFLKQMVRNMVGTIVEVARGERSLVAFEALLDKNTGGFAARRQEAGLCAPPQGLFLKRVQYT